MPLCDKEEYAYQLKNHNERLKKDPTNIKIIEEMVAKERMYQKIARLEREKAEAAKLIEEQENYQKRDYMDIIQCFLVGI